MKKSLLLLYLICTLTLSAGGNIGDVISTNDSIKSQSEFNDETVTDNEIIDTKEQISTETKDKNMISVEVQIGNKNFLAKFYNNNSVKQLVEQMPITLEMSEMNGNEKYNYMDNSLPTNSESVRNIHTGDLMLYGSDCLVLFYKDFRTSYNYTRLGYIEDISGFVDAVGNGNIQITFSVEKSSG